MHIRSASVADVDEILRIYDAAKLFMRATGNLTQWTGGYPSREVVLSDIVLGQLYVCEEEDVLLGVFCHFLGEDPTYRVIDGAWEGGAPYGVIHRIAVAERAHGKGVAAACFAYAKAHTEDLRIDTHADNLPMQRALEKNGFCHRGVIYLENGDPRLAYQWLRAEEEIWH